MRKGSIHGLSTPRNCVSGHIAVSVSTIMAISVRYKLRSKKKFNMNYLHYVVGEETEERVQH